MSCVEPGGTAAARDDVLVALHGLSGGCVGDCCVGKVCSTRGADDALSSGGAWPAQEADGARHSQHAAAPAPSKVLAAVRKEVNRMVDTHQANHAMPATSSSGPSREGAFGRPGSRQVGQGAETWAARRCANRTSHVSSEANQKGSPGWPRDVADACICQGGTSLAGMSTCRWSERYDALADAMALQQRYFDEMSALRDEVRELAQAQQRTEQRVEQLAEAQQKTEHALQLLARQVGGLSDKLGGSLEDLAVETLPYVLSESWGMQVSDCGHDSFVVDGREVDVDLVLRGTIGGAKVVVLGEVKARLTAREVDAFLQVAERHKGVVGCDDVRVVFFGFQANLDARARVREAGAAMVFSNGRLL